MKETNCWMIAYLDRGICRFCYPQTNQRCGVAPNDCMYLLDLDGHECTHWQQYGYLAKHDEDALCDIENLSESEAEFWVEIERLYDKVHPNESKTQEIGQCVGERDVI